jgi:hypothetical protein
LVIQGELGTIFLLIKNQLEPVLFDHILVGHLFEVVEGWWWVERVNSNSKILKMVIPEGIFYHLGDNPCQQGG